MVSSDHEERGGFRELSAVARRRWPVALVALVLVVTFTVIAGTFRSDLYGAVAEVAVRQPAVTASLGADLDLYPPDPNEQRRLALARPVVDEVRGAVGDEPRLQVAVSGDGRIVSFSAQSTDPERAAAAANLHAAAFVDHRRDVLTEEYQISLEVLEDRPAEPAGEGSDPSERLLEQIGALQVLIELVQRDAEHLITPASVPSAALDPVLPRSLLPAVMVGMLLGLLGAVIFELVDRSVHTRSELERAAGGRPVLAVVPRIGPGDGDPRSTAAGRVDPESPGSGSYRVLASAVRSGLRRIAGATTTGTTVSVAGPLPGSGATTTAANLALASARTGRRVVVVDCDLRNPGLHERFGLDNEVGFTSVLRGEISLEAAARRITDEPNLVVITAGPMPADPAELLAGTRATSFVTSLADQADLVILDLPPLLAVPDGLETAPSSDAVLLVAGAGQTRRDELAECLDDLDQIGIEVVGTVLNRGRTLRRGPYGAVDLTGDGDDRLGAERPGERVDPQPTPTAS